MKILRSLFAWSACLLLLVGLSAPPSWLSAPVSTIVLAAPAPAPAPIPRVYLDVPLASHEGPRGFQPELLEHGWPWLSERVVAAIKKHHPHGAIVRNYAGEERGGPMRLDAWARLMADPRCARLADRAAFSEFIDDVSNALAEFGAKPTETRVGVYLGTALDWHTATFGDVDKAINETAMLNPSSAFVIWDAVESPEFARLLFNSGRRRGFTRAGYEPLPPRGGKFNDASADLCLITGWFFDWQRKNPGKREAIATLGGEVVVQCEAPFNTPAHFKAARDAGCSVMLPWYFSPEEAAAVGGDRGP